MDYVQRLKFRSSCVERKTVSVLQCIPNWPGYLKLDLHLDLFSMSIGMTQRALNCIVLCGKANALETLWLCESTQPRPRDIRPPIHLPRVLSVCLGLTSLQLELPFAVFDFL